MKPLPAEDVQYVLKHTHSLWHEFKSARIFITGATGFIGQWLVAVFLAANKKYQLNLEIVGLSRYSQQATIPFITGDITNFSFPAGDFSHIIHAAIEACAVDQMYNHIVEGAKHIKNFARFANCNRI